MLTNLKNFLKNFYPSLKGLFVFAFSFIILTSCVPAPNSKRATSVSGSTTTTTTSSDIPTFKDSYNFFQNGGTVYTATFSIAIDFSDSFYFRGKDVDTYIRSSNKSTPICMIARFPSSSVNKVLILAMQPRSTYNYTNQTTEYYYTVSPSDITTNQNYCLKTALINKLSLSTQYSSLTQIYKFKDLCTSSTACSTAGYTSDQIQLFSNAGVQLTSMATSGLLFSIKYSPTSSTPTNSSCVTNNECKTQGYDCCISNQCVKDLQARTLDNTTKASSEYLQAIQDILNYPSKIYNYPQYYYICSTNNSSSGSSGSSGSSSSGTTPETIAAQERINKLTSYYTCVNKVEGESGRCVKKITGVTATGTYSVGIDDRNFSTTFTNDNYSTYLIPPLSSIEKITYGSVTLFDYSSLSDTDLAKSIISDSGAKYFTLVGHTNDDLTTGASITLLPGVFDKAFGATSTTLEITYKNDASCTYVNSTTSKCEKYYVQSQTSSSSNKGKRVTDHYPASNKFKLPSYANTTKTIKVELDGVTLIQGTDWDVTTGSPSFITLYPLGSGSLRAQKDQVVKITYFSTLEPMKSKLEALDAIKTTCSCTDYSCNISPVKNSSGVVTDYTCVYPTATVNVPLSQKFYLSSKAVPMRYYDSAGLAVDTFNSSATAEEGSNEGLEVFKYTNNDLSKPNNLSNYIGFHEIYGSITSASGAAKPPQMVNVKKNNSYDIFVDYGSYYSCVNCGADYYSQINKLFPSLSGAGGLIPNQTQSSRIATDSSMIRADEFAFGRACFVPATMIPWSHSISSDLANQRKNRLQTQHFLFANGYQRDWYGFDYGSVIGSFDGVKWFAIGTNRRIKATSNKLYIAVNGYMGDLTVDSTYTVSINDSTLNPTGTGMITTDIDNDGAQCQRYHQCSVDKDCYATLGPDYTCSSVTEITTSWPVFDDNANELPDSTVSNNQLTNILGLNNPGKRCVYRGRGSLCTQAYNSVNTNSTFNQTASYDFHACSSNNYCQSFTEGSSYAAKFNNRVNRYGKVISDDTKDTFGFGTPIAMRPFKYNGEEIIRSTPLHNLSANKAVSMCVPGKNPEATTFATMNSSTPDASNYIGDRVIGNGQTLLKLTSADTNYLNACGTFDSTGNYFYKSTDPTITNSTNSSLVYSSGGQNISTNSLYYFNSLFNLKGLSFTTLASNVNSRLTTVSFQKNSCMKAAGASCYTDIDCAPSKTIASKIALLSSSDSSFNTYLNPYEIKYWQENLICSQEVATTDSKFDPKNNRCCREVGNVISIGQNSVQLASDAIPKPTTDKVPGIDIALNNIGRYSRVATYYNEMKNDSTNYPALSIPIADQCSNSTCFDYSKLTNQFKTLMTVGTKTSCSANWVRSFANGTHTWSSTKFQSFNANAFQCYNFTPGSGNFSCSGADDENDSLCKFVQTSPTNAKAKAVFKFMGKMELMGIPQIAIPTEAEFTGSTDGDLSCRSNPVNQNYTYPTNPNNSTATDNSVAPRTINNYSAPLIWWKNLTSTLVGSVQVNDVQTTYKSEISDTLKNYYSAIDTSNFNSNFKQVFKSDEIVACLPAGTKMTSTSEANKCCTGYINSTNMKCQLPDFVDVSIYTNKYVSSEGNSLNENLFDEDGYIKDPTYVAQLACAKSMCASGKLTFGVLISNLKIPGLENASNSYYRFLQNSSATDDLKGMLTLYNKGLKINTHAYCLPSTSSVPDLTVITCQ